MIAVSREIDLSESIAQQIEAKRRGYRQRIFHGGKLCSRCLANPPAAPDSYCHPCRAQISAAFRIKQKDELHRLRALAAQGGMHG